MMVGRKERGRKKGLAVVTPCTPRHRGLDCGQGRTGLAVLCAAHFPWPGLWLFGARPNQVRTWRGRAGSGDGTLGPQHRPPSPLRLDGPCPGDVGVLSLGSPARCGASQPRGLPTRQLFPSGDGEGVEICSAPASDQGSLKSLSVCPCVWGTCHRCWLRLVKGLVHLLLLPHQETQSAPFLL